MATENPKRPFLEEKIKKLKNIPGQAVETLRSALVYKPRFNRSAGAVPAHSQPNANPFVAEQPTVSFKPIKPEVTTSKNPNHTQLRSEFGGFETPEQRRARRQVATPQTTVQPDRLPASTPVEISQRNPMAVEQSYGEKTPDIDPVKQKVIVGAQGTTISAEADAVNEKKRQKVAQETNYRRIIDSASSTKKQVTEAIEKLTVSLRTGDAAAVAGEVVGASVEGGSEGYEKGETQRKAAAQERINKFEASLNTDVPPPAEEIVSKEKATLSDSKTPPVSDEVVLKNKASARAAEIAELNNIVNNKDFDAGQRKAARAKLAELAGVPKASRTVGERLGLGPKPIDPATGEPVTKTKKPSKTLAAVKGIGGAATVLEAGDLGATYAANVAEYGLDEANRRAKEGVSDFVDESTAGLSRQATRLDQGKFGEAASAAGDFAVETGKHIAGLPASIYDQGGRLGYSLRNYLGSGAPESGIYRADPNDPRKVLQGQTTDIGSQEALDITNAGRADELAAFDAENGVVQPPAPEEGQQLIDEARAGDQPAGLRSAKNMVAPPNNHSYFINNQTGEAPGEKQFFHDIEKNFPESQQPEQGLRGARNELSNRNRFLSDERRQQQMLRRLERGGQDVPDKKAFNPAANMMGLFAQGRQNATDREQSAYEDRTTAGLTAAAGTSQSTANTATQKARAKEASEIYQQVADPETRKVGMSRAVSQMTADIENGVQDSTDPVSIAASDMIAQSIMEANDTGVLKGVWNSLMPAFLGGGGKGIRAFFSGEPLLNSQNIPQSLAIDEDGDVIIKSADPTVRGIDIGNEMDASMLSFLRRTLPLEVDENTKTFADATIRK